jgi:hypothetical protein
MKRFCQSFAVTLGILLPGLIAVAYAISCSNAGQVISLDRFSNGLLYHVSNCGGNSAAGSNCRNVAVLAVVAGSESGDTLDFKHLSSEYQNELACIDTLWTPDAKYLLRSGPIHTGHDTHEVVVVCDTPYGNVPQPTIWNLHHRTLRHAAGFSDGSLGWLTPAEFAALNKSNFFELLPRSSNITNSNSFE